MLRLSVLMENTAAEGFVCEHGLSFLLESDDAVILFDTGASGFFLENAARMGCDFGKVTHVVLSHGHYDHTGGLGAALRHIRQGKGGAGLPPLIAHPGVLTDRRRAPGDTKEPHYLGMPTDSRAELAAWPRLFSVEPLHITERIVFLGEIPHRRPEMCALIGETTYNGAPGMDMLHDDSALAYVTDAGLVIIAGCSHSGIVNIIEHAKSITGATKIRAIYGGLHCRDMMPETLAETRKTLAAENLEQLFACHCTGNALDDFPMTVALAAGKRRTVIH